MIGGNVTLIFFNVLQFHLFRLLYHFDIRDYGVGQTHNFLSVAAEWSFHNIESKQRQRYRVCIGAAWVRYFNSLFQKRILVALTWQKQQFTETGSISVSCILAGIQAFSHSSICSCQPASVVCEVRFFTEDIYFIQWFLFWAFLYKSDTMTAR